MRNSPWFRNFAFALIYTPAISFFIPLSAAFAEPGLVIEYWDFYLPWLALPIAIGIAMLVYIRRNNKGAAQRTAP